MAVAVGEAGGHVLGPGERRRVGLAALARRDVDHADHLGGGQLARGAIGQVGLDQPAVGAVVVAGHEAALGGLGREPVAGVVGEQPRARVRIGDLGEIAVPIVGEAGNPARPVGSAEGRRLRNQLFAKETGAPMRRTPQIQATLPVFRSVAEQGNP